MHGIAFVISLVNVIRASSLFNEGETKTLVFGFISGPFITLTVLTRMTALAIIGAFLGEWESYCIIGSIIVG